MEWILGKNSVKKKWIASESRRLSVFPMYLLEERIKLWKQHFENFRKNKTVKTVETALRKLTRKPTENNT